MAFKRTTDCSYFHIVREVEAIGGNGGALASREQMGYIFDALKTCVPQMVELLVDCVRNPVFFDWEVNEKLRKLKVELEELSHNPQGLLLEVVHSAGYSGALANPLLAPELALNRLDGTILEKFVAENYAAPRIVLAAYGVEHEELLSVAEPLLSDLPSIPRLEEPKSIFVGGDFRQQGEPGMLMGGGGSFYAGDPGKGMHSRLYLRVLNEHQEIQSFPAFNSLFNSTGLFGIYACTSFDFVPKTVDIAARELLAIASPGQVSQIELKRVKESTKSAVLMNLESRMSVSKDMGRQILTHGERKPVEQFLKDFDKINLNDITKLAQKIISSPLTMASYSFICPQL